MTKIVRASLGLPSLRAGLRFQNSKPLFFFEYCNLVLEIWYLAIIDIRTGDLPLPS